MDSASTMQHLEERSTEALRLHESKVSDVERDIAQKSQTQPTEESMQDARELLTILGALEDGKITERGRWIASLPFDPRLGLLTFMGKEQGVLYDSLVLAAVMSAEGGLFYRGTTEEDQRVHDATKTKFSLDKGDSLTGLNVYKAWLSVPDMEQNQWCVTNGLNAKALRSVRKTVNEVCRILQETGAACDEAFQFAEDDITEDLRRMVFRCYSSNLCHHLGQEKAGFYAARANRRVYIHPSSCLNTLACVPEWVVFDQMIQTSRDFITGVTPVDDSWISELDEHTLGFNPEKVRGKVLQQIYSRKVGTKAFWDAVGPSFTRLRQLEEKYCSNNRDVVVIEASIPLWLITVFATRETDDTKRLVDDLASTINNMERKMEMDDREVAIAGEDSEDQLGKQRVVLGKGGEIQYVLMPGDTRKVYITKMLPEDDEDEEREEDDESHSEATGDEKNVEGAHDELAMEAIHIDKTTEDKMREKFSQYGDIPFSKSFGITQKKAWGYLVFKTKEQAQAAVDGTKYKRHHKAQLEHSNKGHGGKVKSGQSAKVTLKLHMVWCQRPSRGFPTIDVAGKYVSRFLKLKKLSVVVDGKSTPLRLSLSNKTLQVHGVTNEMSEDVIKQALQRALREQEKQWQKESRHQRGHQAKDEDEEALWPGKQRPAGKVVKQERKANASGALETAGEERPVQDEIKFGVKIERWNSPFAKKRKHDPPQGKKTFYFYFDEEDCIFSIKNMFHVLGRPPNINVSLINPQQDDLLLTATVEFINADDGLACLKDHGLKDFTVASDPSRLVCLEAKPHCTASTLFHQKQWNDAQWSDAEHPGVSRIIHKLKDQGMHVDHQKERVNMEQVVTVRIEGSSPDKVLKGRTRIEEYVRGETIDCSNNMLVFTPEGREMLGNLERETGATVKADPMFRSLVIRGSKEARTQIRKLIAERAPDIGQFVEHYLKGDGKPPGLMKALILKYKEDLVGLITDTGLQSARLDFCRHRLRVSGDAQSREKATAEIAKLTEDVWAKSRQDRPEREAELCSVCLTPIEDGQLYRLQVCAHPYCNSCFTQQVSLAVTGRALPTVCCHEGCDRPLAVRDLTFLSRDGHFTLQELTRSAVDAFISTNANDFHQCPTPDCPAIYRVDGFGTDKAQDETTGYPAQDGLARGYTQHKVFACPACSTRTCTHCHKPEHAEQPCLCDHQVGVQAGNHTSDSLSDWRAEDPANRKMCPACFTCIEKNGGCNHVCCPVCKRHICWVCLQVFESTVKCYDHLAAEHGGIFPQNVHG